MRLLKFGVVLAVLTIATTISVSATPITLNSGAAPQPSNAGDGTIRTWLIGVINTYNTAHSTSLPTAVVGAHPDVKVNQGGTAPTGYPTFEANVLSITLPANMNDYLVLHWGGQGGGVYQAFDLATAPVQTFTFNAPGNHGLSFYSFYGTEIASTPEPSTLLTLGTGLIGLAGLARRRLFS